MLKTKTLFKKYFLVFMSIVLFSFLILGSMLWFFISNYWENEKHDVLSKNALNISNIVAQNSFVTDSDKIYIHNQAIMQNFINTFSKNINADIFITDLTGTPILYSHSQKDANFTGSVPMEVVDNIIKNGQYTDTSTMGQIYNHKHFFVGVPVSLNNKIVALVFTSINSHYLDVFKLDILKMFLFSIIFAVILSLIAIGFLSYTLVKPMRQMAAATKSFGQGDFSQRVPVTSDDEVGQLSIAFNNMADSLSESEEIRRNFIANVSHELKTPMTTIAGFVDGILDGTIAPDKQKLYLTTVSNEVKRLSRLVSSMLNLSRIGSGTLKLNLSSFDLLSVVINIFISFEEKISEKNICVTGLDSSESCFIQGDMDLIYQALYNLIENAIKFVNENGYININMSFNKKKIVFKIKNSGSGIKKSDLGHIFDRFYKTDRSRSMDKYGLGLGLYLVRQIMHLHNGEIFADSIENVYTEFTLFFPL